MSQTQLLGEFSRLPLAQQLEIIQAAIQIVAQQTQGIFTPTNGHSTRKSLEEAAKVLLDDYQENAELTSLTALDGEPFYA